MASTNDITGNNLVSRYSKKYEDNYDKIFKKTDTTDMGELSTSSDKPNQPTKDEGNGS